MSNPSAPTDLPRLLLRVRDVGSVLGISPRQVWKLTSMGRLPAPLRLSRSVRWSADSISDWVRLGCPTREQFEALTAKGRSEK